MKAPPSSDEEGWRTERRGGVDGDSANHRGVVGGFVLKLQSVNGFNGNVQLSCSGGPAGSYCVSFPESVKANGTAYTVSGIFFPKSAIPGTYVIITGISGSLTVKATATFTVK